MAEESTIMLDKKLIGDLKKAKEYPRQTYNELINRMVMPEIKTTFFRHRNLFIFEMLKNSNTLCGFSPEFLTCGGTLFSLFVKNHLPKTGGMIMPHLKNL